MKVSFKPLAISILLLAATTAKSQVIISLVFGEVLNTPKVEFGLMGGLNRSYILDIKEAEGLNNFNIGFYFHILLKNQSYLSTGVLVKSNVGAQGMPTYSRNNADFDSIFVDGTLTKKINYFYVPIMFHQRFNNNRWYAEAGFQLGLRNKAYDIFDNTAADGDVEYTLDVRDEYARLDAGLVAGVGYKFQKEIKSMSLGVNYYYGLVNVSLVPETTIKNSSVYIYMKVPIGAGKI